MNTILIYLRPVTDMFLNTQSQSTEHDSSETWDKPSEQITHQNAQAQKSQDQSQILPRTWTDALDKTALYSSSRAGVCQGTNTIMGYSGGKEAKRN